jgi:hypothetical protein
LFEGDPRDEWIGDGFYWKKEAKITDCERTFEECHQQSLDDKTIGGNISDLALWPCSNASVLNLRNLSRELFVDTLLD